MWAVYLCGCTDCFLHAIFASEKHAHEWAETHGTNPEGYMIEYWKTPAEIDISDTGWQK